MLIKNRDELATSGLRRRALAIIEAGIERVLPRTMMAAVLSFDRRAGRLYINQDTFELTGRLFVVGAGKAAGLMAQSLESIIGADKITDGLVIEKADPRGFDVKSIRVVRAGHPVPDARGAAAANDILNLKPKYAITRGDMVLCLLSGGGSSLMPAPAEGIGLEDKQEVTRLLLSCGAGINEINTVRKHLSRVKGGRLAEHFAPARVVSLIISDVIGNDLGTIASGPACADSSTFTEAYDILKNYHLLEKIPASVRAVMEKGCRGEITETPKSLDNARNYIIGDVGMALEAMAAKAAGLGYRPLIISAAQTGDSAGAARRRAREILGGSFPGYDALLIGGETTPTLPDNPGKGGRNQHYAAVSMLEMGACDREWVMAAVGTDGSDYLPDVAGAIVDSSSLAEVRNQAVDAAGYIERYDSNTLFKKIGRSLIVTGATGTNVGDVMLYLLES